MEKGERYFRWGVTGLATAAVSGALGFGVGRFEVNNFCTQDMNPGCAESTKEWPRVRAGQYVNFVGNGYGIVFLLCEGLSLAEGAVEVYDKARGKR